MEKRRILNTQIEVSPICLGTMTFGNPVAKADAIRLVRWALDHGINFIDTADMYEGYDRHLGSAGGVAESILGEALADRSHQAVVTTKVGNSVGNANYQGSGLGRTHILHQIDMSLKRMKTDYADIYELHVQDPATPLIESLSVMADLITKGKIRHWGFSNFDSSEINEMVRLCDENSWPRPVISQPPYSWLHRDVEDEYLSSCRQFEMSVTPYQPLQGGLLTGKYRRGEPIPAGSRAAESSWLNEPDNDLYDRLERFEAEARAANCQPAHYAVKWLLDQPSIASVVVGVKHIEQLEDLRSGIG